MQQNQIVDADTIKRILEEETGDPYVLKRGSELIHKDEKSWFIHIPWGRGRGWIAHASGENGVITLETSIFLDTRKRIGFDYPAQLGKKRLGQAISDLVDREVRHRFEKQIPAIVALLDVADQTLADANKKHTTNAKLVGGSSGLVSAEAKLTSSDGEEVRQNVRALMEFDEQVAQWLKTAYDKLLEAESYVIARRQQSRKRTSRSPI